MCAAIATGPFKKLVAKKQSALGTKATTGSAQYLRRVTSTLDLAKATYKSNEIRPSQQKTDMRHGIRSVAGTLNCELSCGSYQGPIESVLRAAATTAATTGAIITVAAAVTSGASGTFTRSSGSYLTDGFRIGMVVRWSGWATTGVPNNAHNFLITSLSALVMTGTMLDAVAVGAKVAGDTVTCLQVGKHVAFPNTGHTKDFWTIEHFFEDIAQSEQFTDCVFGAMDVKLPPTGMATIDFPVMGLNMDTSTSAYFVTPTAASSGAVMAAVNGAVYVGGVKVGLIKNLDYKVDGKMTAPGGIVGSNVDPDIFQGVIDVTGNMSVYFSDATMRDYFLNETETSMIAVFTSGSAADADVQSHVFPRIKFGGATKDDGETGLTQTMPFEALENVTAATGTIATSYFIQDSLFV